MTKQKVALILHGWPGPHTAGYSLRQLLINANYRLIIPNLFDTTPLPYTVDKMIANIYSSLGKQKPDLIIGISMGGLLLPHLAKNFPQAKLVFIASGAKLQPIGLAKVLFSLLASPFGLPLIKLIYRLPSSLITWIYMHSRITQGGDRYKALADMQKNLSEVKKYPPDNHASLMQCLAKLDNTQLISALPNRSLIFAGNKDIFFPPEISSQLHQSLTDSQIIWTPRPHFCVFGKEELLKLKYFIS